MKPQVSKSTFLSNYENKTRLISVLIHGGEVEQASAAADLPHRKVSRRFYET